MARLGVEFDEATLPVSEDVDVTARETAYHLLDLGPEPFRSFQLECLSGPGMETGPRHVWSRPNVQREANSIPFPLQHVQLNRPGRYTFRLTTWSEPSYQGDSDTDVRHIMAWATGDLQTRDNQICVWMNDGWLPIAAPVDEIQVRLTTGAAFAPETVLNTVLQNPQDGRAYLITSVDTSIQAESGNGNIEVLARARPLTANEVSNMVRDQASSLTNHPLVGFPQRHEAVSMGTRVAESTCSLCQESSCNGCDHAADEEPLEPPKDPPPPWHERLGKLLS